MRRAPALLELWSSGFERDVVVRCIERPKSILWVAQLMRLMRRAAVPLVSSRFATLCSLTLVAEEANIVQHVHIGQG